MLAALMTEGYEYKPALYDIMEIMGHSAAKYSPTGEIRQSAGARLFGHMPRIVPERRTVNFTSPRHTRNCGR